MKKYVLYVHYKRENIMTCNYFSLTAKNFKEAIEEADAKYNPETMYLIRIMEKYGTSQKEPGGFRSQIYKAIECKRDYKWCANTSENGEKEHYVKRYYCKRKNDESFEWM